MKSKMRFLVGASASMLLGRTWYASWTMLVLALATAHAESPPGIWTKVTSPHFTILTPAPEVTARAWAVELEQFRRGLQAIVPVPAEKLRPVTVVLFKTAREMEPYLPLEKGKPARLDGFFVRADEINTIMLSLAGRKEHIRHTVFHEAVHWHLSALEGPLPLWLGEGLAELYATFELTDSKTYSFGEPMPAYVGLLQRQPLMPLVRLFGTGRESLLYNEGNRATIFYAQSWALVHYLFFGEGSPGRTSVVRYLELLRTARTPDEAFDQAFGGSYAVVEQRLKQYIRKGSYRKHLYPRSTDDITRLLKGSRAAPGDLELAQGALLLGARHPEAAEPHLRRAVALAPRDPRGWELLGHIAIGRKDYEAATEVLQRAAEAGSTNYLVYHNLGVAHFPPSALPTLILTAHDPVRMDTAAEGYRKAIALAPSHAPSYEGLAGLAHSMQTFRPADLELLQQGLRVEPSNVTIETGLAAAEIRAGRNEEGRQRLAELVARHRDERGPGLDFARRVYATETLKVEMEEIDRLARKGQFEPALKIVERALARGPEAQHRQTLERAGRALMQYRIIAQSVAAANRGAIDEARRGLEQLLREEPESAIRSDAQRLLKEIERHRSPRR